MSHIGLADLVLRLPDGALDDDAKARIQDALKMAILDECGEDLDDVDVAFWLKGLIVEPVPWGGGDTDDDDDDHDPVTS